MTTFHFRRAAPARKALVLRPERVADFLCELKLLRHVAQDRLKPSDYPRHTVALVCATDGTRLRIRRQVSNHEARHLAHDIGLDLARLRRGNTGARHGARHVAAFEKKWPRREGVPCGAESRAGPNARCSKGRPRGDPDRVRARTAKPPWAAARRRGAKPRPAPFSKYRTTLKYQRISALAVGDRKARRHVESQPGLRRTTKVRRR